MKGKKWNLGDSILLILLGLLIIPQTRKPILVGLNSLRIQVISPSEMDQRDQLQLIPFDYRVANLKNRETLIPVGKGKVTFISYWATWCPPCIAELPGIQQLYTKFKDQVNFILITDEQPEKVTLFLNQKGYDLPVYFSRMKTPDALLENSIPTNYVINKNGKIVIKEKGAENWNSEGIHTVIARLISE